MNMIFPVTGKMSWFGGPLDYGVAFDEGLALIEEDDLQDYGRFGYLFLPPKLEDPKPGLARRLNPNTFYLAMRWNYSQFPRAVLRQSIVKLTANGRSIFARPADWGPNDNTGRLADLSRGSCDALGLVTDDEVTCSLILP
jgi:hypothetical protein